MGSIQTAYLAQGRLFFKPDGAPAREITSQFVQRANDSARQAADRNAWKTSSRQDDPAMMASRMLWRGAAARGMSDAHITGVTRGAKSEILFALQSGSVGGIFAHDPTDGSERRLYHKNSFIGRHLARHPASDLVALSVAGNQLEANIAVTDTEAHRLREVTEGDSVDECPTWVPGESQTLVFQSAGIGRNAQGMQTGIGPYRIEQLDLVRGDMKALEEDEAYDFLCPRVSIDGSLYFIRRPWSPHTRPISSWAMAADVLYFPYRLIRTFVHFFNFMSIAFSHKPLITSDGSSQPEQKAATMMLWGKLIDAEETMKKMKKDGSVALIPSNWELIRRPPGGKDETLAKSVASFDLTPEGSVVYTDGMTVYLHDPHGQKQTLCTDKLIEGVACWGQ